jgi:hypothetical protein
MDEQDALDILTMLSLVHRKLNKARRRGKQPTTEEAPDGNRQRQNDRNYPAAAGRLFV